VSIRAFRLLLRLFATDWSFWTDDVNSVEVLASLIGVVVVVVVVVATAVVVVAVLFFLAILAFSILTNRRLKTRVRIMGWIDNAKGMLDVLLELKYVHKSRSTRMR